MRFFNDKISLGQLQALLVLDLFGTGVITVPRVAARFGGADGWLVVLVSVLVMLLCTYLVASAGRLFPEDSFVSYSGKLLGRPLGIALGLGLVAKILLGIAIEVRIFIEVVRETMLATTPYVVIFAAIIGVAAYAAGKGFETRARLAELLIPLVFLPFVGVMFLAALGADYTNLLPVLRASQPRYIVSGGLTIALGYKGIEYLLLAHPYVERPEGLRRASLRAVAATGALVLVSTIITLATFGAEGLSHQRWPFLEVMDTISFPGAFVERQDAVIMSVWVISVFAIMSSGLFFSAIVLKDTVRRGRRFYYVLGCIPVVYVVSVIPKSIVVLGEGVLGHVFMGSNVVYTLLLPVLIILVAGLRRRSGA